MDREELNAENAGGVFKRVFLGEIESEWQGSTLERGEDSNESDTHGLIERYSAVFRERSQIA